MKKFIFGVIAALLSAASIGATLVPVQLLNPAGSTAAQVIISSGASSVPAWATLTAAQVANAASTASPLSQFAATTSAQLAGVLSDETGTGVAVFGTSPTLTTPNIVGITNASNASAGSVGQTVATTGTAVSLTNATAANLTSISLPAGDWYVWGSGAFAATGGAVPSVFVIGINITSAMLPASTQLGQISATFAANGFASILAPMQRINISSTTTVYLVGQMNYNSGTTGTGTGSITAVRLR